MDLQNPSEASQERLKRAAKYMRDRTDEGIFMPYQGKGSEDVDDLDTATDTDWACCKRTRSSTMCIIIMLNQILLVSRTAGQAIKSQSSGEAEFYGVVKASGAALGQQSLFADLGIKLQVRVWTDSSAAIGICSRQGLGKLRHLDTHTLWVQQAVRSKRLELKKVLGEENPADLFTKHSISRDRLEKLVGLFDCQFKGGRAESAPQTGGIGFFDNVASAIVFRDTIFTNSFFIFEISSRKALKADVVSRAPKCILFRSSDPVSNLRESCRTRDRVAS